MRKGALSALGKSGSMGPSSFPLGCPRMDSRKTLLLLAFASALPAVGGTVVMPDSPAPAFADLEGATNAPWGLIMK